jgi:hypothetical protein
MKPEAISIAAPAGPFELHENEGKKFSSTQ